MSAESARQALYGALEVASETADAEGLLKLANAWALLQPDEQEDEPEGPIHQVGGTQFLPMRDEVEVEGYEERSRIVGFQPSRAHTSHT